MARVEYIASKVTPRSVKMHKDNTEMKLWRSAVQRVLDRLDQETLGFPLFYVLSSVLFVDSASPAPVLGHHRHLILLILHFSSFQLLSILFRAKPWTFSTKVWLGETPWSAILNSIGVAPGAQSILQPSGGVFLPVLSRRRSNCEDGWFCCFFSFSFGMLVFISRPHGRRANQTEREK